MEWIFNKPTSLPKIASADLAADDLPPSDPCWRDIVKFCATFDIRAEFGEHCGVRSIFDVSAESSTAEMRAGLWNAYRCWNHRGRDPDDDETLPKAIEICSWIRSRLTSN